MSENLTVGRRTSHFSLKKKRLLISFFLQQLLSKTSNTIWVSDCMSTPSSSINLSLVQIVLDRINLIIQDLG